MPKRLSIKDINHISDAIEQIVKRDEVTYIEACIEYCNEHDIEPATVGDMVKRNVELKALIETEARGLNCMKKEVE